MSDLSNLPNHEGVPLFGARILIVEDEFLLAEVMAMTLADWGATMIGPGTTVDEGLALIETAEFDVAVLDANLRGRSVYPLAEALHERGTPFVFLSGYHDMPRLRARFPDAPTFEKPTSLEMLRTTLAGLLPDDAPARRERSGMSSPVTG